MFKKILLILFSFPLLAQAAMITFTDVTDQSLYSKSIFWMADQGIIRGYPDNTFRPATCVKRVEFAKMLLLMANIDVAKYKAPLFKDTKNNEWYAPYIKAVRSLGIIEGYPDGTFKPEICVNRVEAIKMASRHFFKDLDLDSVDMSEFTFKDENKNAWYSHYLHFAFNHDLIGLEHVDDEKDFFFPAGAMSRQEAAEMLYRMKASYDAGIPKRPTNMPEEDYKAQFIIPCSAKLKPEECYQLYNGIMTPDGVITAPAVKQVPSTPTTPTSTSAPTPPSTELRSDFFKNDPVAKSIITTGLPEEMSKYHLLINNNVDKNNFGYKFLAALHMLGYSMGRDNMNTKHLILLRQFQKQNGFSESNTLTQPMLLKIDQLLADREIKFKLYEQQFPLYSHMANLSANEVEKDYIAMLYTLPIQALPDALQMKGEQAWIDCIKVQCLGFLQPSNTPQVSYYYEPIAAGSDYVFSAAYFDPNRNGAFVPSSSVVVETVLHEYAHQLSNTGIINAQPFYEISWNFQEKDPVSGCAFSTNDNVSDFISRYGSPANVNPNCVYYWPGEEFAESFAAYVVAGQNFRAAANINTKIAQKYNWLKNNVFQGLEYDTNLIVDSNSGCFDAEGVPPQPGYLSCSENYIWNGELKVLP